MSKLITYPLNNIDYRAEDAELFHCTRKSGVWAENSFACSVNGEDNNITVDKGVAWIQNTEFAGKVVAMKGVTVIDAGVADDLNDRIDVVAIQFDANENETKIVIKHGDPVLTNPQIPEINRSGGLFELYLCSIYRTAGKTAISVSDVTDLRLNPDYCGLMADSVTRIDTSMIDSQISELIKELRGKIDSVSLSAENVIFDKAETSINSENVQDAIVEISERVDNNTGVAFASAFTYSPNIGDNTPISLISFRRYGNQNVAEKIEHYQFSSTYGMGIRVNIDCRLLVSAHMSGKSTTGTCRLRIMKNAVEILRTRQTVTTGSFATIDIPPYLVEAKNGDVFNISSIGFTTGGENENEVAYLTVIIFD